MTRKDALALLKLIQEHFSLYPTKKGYTLRGKGGVDGKKMKKDKRFKRTMQNSAEFGRVSNGSTVLRNTFHVAWEKTHDSQTRNRLTGLLSKVVKTDNSNPLGERVVNAGNIKLIEGFNFNIKTKFDSISLIPFKFEADRTKGSLSISWPKFSPEKSIKHPKTATHFRWHLSSAEIDLSSEDFPSVRESYSETIPLQRATHPSVKLSQRIQRGSKMLLFVVLAIEFYTETNGKGYPSFDSQYNAACIVRVLR